MELLDRLRLKKDWYVVKTSNVIDLLEKEKDRFPWAYRPGEKYRCLIYWKDGAIRMTVDEFYKIDDDTYKCLRPYTTSICTSLADYNNLTKEELVSKAYNAWCSGAR